MNNSTIRNDMNHNYFRLFSYLAVTVLSMSVIVGLFLIIQHIADEDNSKTFIANQETLLQNQNYLKNISNILHEHEIKEMSELEKRTEISYNNSMKLDRILDIISSGQ